jgi:hypothetical protein
VWQGRYWRLSWLFESWGAFHGADEIDETFRQNLSTKYYEGSREFGSSSALLFSRGVDPCCSSTCFCVCRARANAAVLSSRTEPLYVIFNGAVSRQPEKAALRSGNTRETVVTFCWKSQCRLVRPLGERQTTRVQTKRLPAKRRGLGLYFLLVVFIGSCSEISIFG